MEGELLYFRFVSTQTVQITVEHRKVQASKFMAVVNLGDSYK